MWGVGEGNGKHKHRAGENLSEGNEEVVIEMFQGFLLQIKGLLT